MTSTSSPAADDCDEIVYLDLTHLGRHVTGIERIAIELFERSHFAGTVVRPVRARGIISMIWRQQVLLPLLALLHPRAKFVFPGFPPSPLFIFARSRTYLYVYDLFLITRRPDLSSKAKLYMAWPFRIAVTHLKNFFVISEKTLSELAPCVPADASIALYRPGVANVFQLSDACARNLEADGGSIRLVSIGTVEPRKNYAAAAQISVWLNELSPRDVELHIIGRAGWGPDAELLKSFPKVIVHGFLPAAGVKAVIEAADVYLCTSHDEGLGLPLLEVQYAGLPVVAPDQPVFREVLGESALFIDPGDAKGAATKILDLISSPGCRQRSVEAARINIERWNALAADDAVHAQKLFTANRMPISASMREAQSSVRS